MGLNVFFSIRKRLDDANGFECFFSIRKRLDKANPKGNQKKSKPTRYLLLFSRECEPRVFASLSSISATKFEDHIIQQNLTPVLSKSKNLVASCNNIIIINWSCFSI